VTAAGGMIVDFHTHVDEAEAFGWIDPPDKLVPLLDEAGIAKAACMTYVDLPGGNPEALDYIARAVSRFPDRLIGFARLNPNYRQEAEAALRRAVAELGFLGVKLHPTSTLAHPAGEPTVALMRLAGTLGVPVLFHCGDDPYTTPQAIAAGARQAPDTAVVLGHMGGYFHVDDAIAMAERQANLYLETSAMPYPGKIAEAVERVGAERVVFGSDGPGCNPALEVEKIRILGLDAGAEGLVLGGNAARILGIEEVAS
jgi:predicted TIM-barrel fold metal-dependent hydrolase